MKISRLWIVTKPNKNSTMQDICFETDFAGLQRQFTGGLKPDDIVAAYDSRAGAEQKARHELIKARRSE